MRRVHYPTSISVAISESCAKSEIGQVSETFLFRTLRGGSPLGEFDFGKRCAERTTKTINVAIDDDDGATRAEDACR